MSCECLDCMDPINRWSKIPNTCKKEVTMKKLTLTIEMGNAAMRTRVQAVAAVAEAARKMGNPAIGDSGIIRDINGNTVGKWSIE